MPLHPLTLELKRIIDCSYPASLASLAEQLTYANSEQIRASIYEFPPCSISKLATIVYQALPQWSYTFEALSHLCQSSEFRDTIFLQNPEFLDALLAKAVSSQRNFNNYFETCILLLSHSLPTTLPLPLSAQAFFLQIFEKANQNLNVSNLKSMYRMLNGACHNMLSILPLEQRQIFDEQLCHILSSLNGAEQDFMLPLWCFGIVLCAERPGYIDTKHRSRQASERIDHDSHSECTWNFAAGRKLFGSTSKVHKTISLTYLGVVWATKGGVGIAEEEAIEGIQIAYKILSFIDPGSLKAWPTSSSLAKNSFPKLLSKALQAVNPVIQVYASAIYAMVAPGTSLPSEILVGYEDSMMRVILGKTSVDLAQAVSTSFLVYAPQLPDSAVQVLLCNLLDICLSESKPPLLPDAIALVENISCSSTSCQPLRASLASALASDNLQSKIEDLVKTELPTDIPICCTYSAATRWKLIPAVIAALLTAAFASNGFGPTLPLSIITSLIEQQRHLRAPSGDCRHSINVPESRSLSLFEQRNTPYTGQHLEDWRQRLKSELESQNVHQRDTITRSVAEICQDLESRCDTIEEPLRREKAKCQALEDRLQRLHDDIASLESQAADGRFQLDGLEDEKQALLDEKESLTAKFDDLQRLYHQANDEAAEVLHNTKEHFSTREVELRSAILTYEESLRDSAEEVKEQNRMIIRLHGELDELHEERRALKDQNLQSKRDLKDAQNVLEREQERNATHDHEYRQLQQDRDRLEVTLKAAQTQVKEAMVNMTNLQSQHDELLRSSEAERKNLEARYTDDISVAARRVEEQHETHRIRLEEALEGRQRLEAEYQHSRREFSSLQEIIPPLEARLEQLLNVCSEQESELEELKTWRRNVLESMGLDEQASLAMRPAPHSGKEKARTVASLGSCEHRRRKSTLQVNQPADVPHKNADLTRTEGHVITSVSRAESEAYSSQESTPKRAKPRTTFKVPSTKDPLVDQPVFISKVPSKQISLGKRSALGQMSPNRRHTTVGFAALDQDSGKLTQESQSTRPRRGSIQTLEVVPDVNMDSFWAGTPLTQGDFATGTGKFPGDYDDEDGTMTEL